MKSIFLICSLFLCTTTLFGQDRKVIKDISLMGNRFLTFNTVIRVYQVEATRDKHFGADESKLHTPARVVKFREAIAAAFPNARITWAFSWLALHDTSYNYRKIRKIVIEYHRKYGDAITFIPGGYFANVYNSTKQVDEDLRDALGLIKKMVGNNYQPLSVLAGFLSSKNQSYLAEKEGIHVCQGNIWSQYDVDYQDGEGSVCYPYYPSKEHFCKPAQNKKDFIDCVNLNGWSVDFLAARRPGFADGFNSRMGVGPIETIGKYGPKIGLQEMMHTTAEHFDKGFKLNGFAWVTSCWELSLPIDVSYLTDWLNAIKKRWPNVKFLTQGEFGMIWRKHYKTNSFNYMFEEKGSGIGGSDKNKELYWFMNKTFRLAILRDLKSDSEKVIDFTRYDLSAKEPASGKSIRNWSLMGEINQKQTRPRDTPVPINQLSGKNKSIIREYYPELFSEQCATFFKNKLRN